MCNVWILVKMTWRVLTTGVCTAVPIEPACLSVCPAPTLTQPWKNATFKLQGKQYVMLTTGAAYLTVCHADAYDW